MRFVNWAALLSTIIVGSISLSGSVFALPISQVDQITLGGATYPGDQWTLTLTDPLSYSATYTVPGGADFGCNICNVTAGWGAAINANPVFGSLFTATYQVWDGVSPYNPVITLTGIIPGQSWTASVSVFDGFSGGNPLPLEVSIVTLVEAYNDPMSVPTSQSIMLLVFGLLGIAGLNYHRRSACR